MVGNAHMRKKARWRMLYMSRRSKYFKTIEHLMETGYEAKDICKISGIPRATVYRIVDKLREEAKLNFKDLMEKDYLYKYQRNLEELSKTIIQCNERMIEVDVKYNALEGQAQTALEAVEVSKHISKAHLISNLIAIQSGRTNEIIKLIAQRDRASEVKATLYNKGPVVYRINEFVQNKLANIPHMLETGITASQSHISDDDKVILSEMERDV